MFSIYLVLGHADNGHKTSLLLFQLLLTSTYYSTMKHTKLKRYLIHNNTVHNKIWCNSSNPSVHDEMWLQYIKHTTSSLQQCLTFNQCTLPPSPAVYSTNHHHNSIRSHLRSTRCYSLSVLRAISRWTWASRYQNVSIPGFIGAKGDGSGGNNWSYMTCKAPVKISLPTNQHPVFYQQCQSGVA